MSSSSSSKSTRKTYSFEEREILISLINKYGDVTDKKSDPNSMCKRKSAWAKLAEEYNIIVGPDATRTAVQLRRCWENMKACKKNREDKRGGTTSKNVSQITNDRLRMSLGSWQDGSPGQGSLDNSATASTVGLPPNVVFEPKASEPFTLQSVSASKAAKLTLKNSIQKDYECKELMAGSSSKQNIAVVPDFPTKMELQPPIGPMGDCPEKFLSDRESYTEDNQSECCRDHEAIGEQGVSLKTNASQGIQTSPIICQNRYRRINAYAQTRDEELHILALSEAQMKVDIAALQKEEARVRLEEVRYRKEEAKLRMLVLTYKLERIKED